MINNETFLYTPIKEKDSNINFWMAYPGPESFAMSSLGYLWLYKYLDEHEDINVERVYADTTRTKISSENVDLIGFSFTFDTDFMHIFSMLSKFNIPLRKKLRTSNYPLIFAGGPVVTTNPTPYEEFFDFFIIGDGENIIIKITELYQNNKNLRKEEFLTLISEIDGIYIPNITAKTKKVTERLDRCIYTPILSGKAFFPNTFIMEVSRGCANRCGFCIASYLNLPLRCLPYENIIETIDLGLKYTNKIALLGAQLSAHPKFEDICDYIYNKLQTDKKIEMSVSSLRVDSITPNILKTLVACGQKNITLAIEAGSERLRKVINKNLTKVQILKAVEIAEKAGLKGFKFYGMIGLPTETDEDLKEMVALAKEIKQAHKGFDISFGFSTFVPKPNTPFQWFGRENIKSLEKKTQYLKKEFHKIGVPVTVSSAKWDYWQAVLSRGDNSLADFLEEVWKQGGKLGAYKSAAKNLKIDTDEFAEKTYDYYEPLPWDFIDIKPGREFLIKESLRLISQS